MPQALLDPWPWYVAGPLIGLFVPLLLLVGGKEFGISVNLRHLCAALLPGRAEFFRYDWRGSGAWNLTFVAGVTLGGSLAGICLGNAAPVAISAATRSDLGALGLADFSGWAPASLFSWAALGSAPGLLLIVGGGFLIGFGSRYAGGCTSGHAITGLACLELPSLVAVIGFFAGGLAATHLLLPALLPGVRS
ncbi:MAG: YeeE/YedE family protein [Planctomycetaceae bacterium]